MDNRREIEEILKCRECEVKIGTKYKDYYISKKTGKETYKRVTVMDDNFKKTIYWDEKNRRSDLATWSEIHCSDCLKKISVKEFKEYKERKKKEKEDYDKWIIDRDEKIKKQIYKCGNDQKRGIIGVVIFRDFHVVYCLNGRKIISVSKDFETTAPILMNDYDPDHIDPNDYEYHDNQNNRVEKYDIRSFYKYEKPGNGYWFIR